jgi:hypothetical protein
MRLRTTNARKRKIRVQCPMSPNCFKHPKEDLKAIVDSQIDRLNQMKNLLMRDLLKNCLRIWKKSSKYDCSQMKTDQGKLRRRKYKQSQMISRCSVKKKEKWCKA